MLHLLYFAAFSNYYRHTLPIFHFEDFESSKFLYVHVQFYENPPYGQLHCLYYSVVFQTFNIYMSLWRY